MRRLLSNVVLLLGGVVVSLLLLEVGLRISHPITQTVKGDRVVLPANYDEVRKNPPGSGLQPEVRIHQNSRGFRGPEPPPDLGDRLSIVTVGGSTTRAAAQSDDRTSTALLGDRVAECFDRTWINNAGFDGHTSVAHIQLIRHYINKLNPKLVLLLVGANDAFLGHVRLQWINRRLDEFATRSEVVDLGLTFHRSFRAWWAGASVATLTEGEPMPTDGEARLAVARELQSQYAERLRQMVRLLREGRSVPVLMTQPTIGGSGRDPTTGRDLSRLAYGQFYQQAFEIYNDTMRDVARRGDVYLIDLARSMPKDTRYYYDNMHYTDAGAQTLAKLVAKELLPYLERQFPSFSKGDCRFPSPENFDR